MSNIIKGNKIYTFGAGKMEGDIESNEEITRQILEIPAISVKGYRDDVIEMNTEIDPPIFKWKIELLKTFDNNELRTLRNSAEKRRDNRAKRY